MISIKNIRYPLIIAHRGYSAKYPENTMSAFLAAADAGVQMIELDVSLTKDRKPVVIHDDTVNRTTDGSGRICDFSLEEIRQLDAGSWFSPCFGGEKIPTLAEVLDMLIDRVCLNIEIKPEAFETDAPDDAVENQIMDLIRERKAHNAVLISSFEHSVLKKISFFPDCPMLGVLTENVHARKIIPLCRTIGAFSWNPDWLCTDREQIEQIHQAGCRVFPYTVNQIREIEKLLEMGADGFFSDDPLLL